MKDAKLIELRECFHDADKAREYLEQRRWPKGAVCPHCGGADPYRLTPKPGSKTRLGLWKCKACRKQFTVTVDTIFSDSKLPLNVWLEIVHMMCSSKKGVSAYQIKRRFEISYKAAWFACHRIRHAMGLSADAEPLDGVVEADEYYLGGKRRNMHFLKRQSLSGRGASGKTPVVILVQRNGSVRSVAKAEVTSKNLQEILKKNVAPTARVMTDEATVYAGVSEHFASHEQVNHSAGEYVRGDATTNSAESCVALMKRGVYGTFHHISERHLHRYTQEFDFRYSARKITDAERTELALKQTEGKRLMYREPKGK